jgi:hypothetical protein
VGKDVGDDPRQRFAFLHALTARAWVDLTNLRRMSQAFPLPIRIPIGGGHLCESEFLKWDISGHCGTFPDMVVAMDAWRS